MTTRLHHIGMITSLIAKSVTNSNAVTFCHTFLSHTKTPEGYKLGINYWADTCCYGKHAFVEKLLKVKLSQLQNLHHP